MTAKSSKNLNFAERNSRKGSIYKCREFHGEIPTTKTKRTMSNNTNSISIYTAVLIIIKMADDESILNLRERNVDPMYHGRMDMWYEQLAMDYIVEVWSRYTITDNEGRELTCEETEKVCAQIIDLVVKTHRANVSAIDLMNKTAKM